MVGVVGVPTTSIVSESFLCPVGVSGVVFTPDSGVGLNRMFDSRLGVDGVDGTEGSSSRGIFISVGVGGASFSIWKTNI